MAASRSPIPFALLAALCASLHAGTPEPVLEQAPPDAAGPSIYDRIWGALVLYKNPENPVIQEFKIRGRQQNEWFYFDNHDTEDSDLINRRTRIGFEAEFFGSLTAHAEADLDLQDPHPLYNKITDAYLEWSPSEAFHLIAGKHGMKFTLDGATSSTALITIDRSQIANNLWSPEEYLPGITATGKWAHFCYNLGYFSSGAATTEFGEFDAGSLGMVSLGYDFGHLLSLDRALLRADYVYQDEDYRNGTGKPNPFTRNHEMVGSINLQVEEGRFSFGADVAGARGYFSQPDLFGVQVMPALYLDKAKAFQAVLRYTYLKSDDVNGIRFARYENRLESGRGDEYNEFYAGLNWYLYGHKLKLQAGVQYATMDDEAEDGGNYDGWGVTTGLRISW
jgi:phosphate-selective porin OprO/OprP